MCILLSITVLILCLSSYKIFPCNSQLEPHSKRGSFLSRGVVSCSLAATMMQLVLPGYCCFCWAPFFTRTLLHVWSDATGQYILKVGQDQELRLFVRVSNRGEDAHEAAVNIVLPPLMEYLGTDSDVRHFFLLLSSSSRCWLQNSSVQPVGVMA